MNETTDFDKFSDLQFVKDLQINEEFNNESKFQKDRASISTAQKTLNIGLISTLEQPENLEKRILKAQKQQYNIKSRDLNRLFLKKALDNKECEIETFRKQNISPLKMNYNEDQNSINAISNCKKITEDDQINIEDKIICLIKTNEPHLKRQVERRQKYWFENKTGNKNGLQQIFDVKFDFQDQPSDYSQLKPFQIYNHFQFNTEITTKSGLCKNLYQNTFTEMKTDQWFPRCYDLSQAGQTDELVEDFYKTSAQIIIKKHKKMFMHFCKESIVNAHSKLMKLRMMKSDKKSSIYNYKEMKSNLQWELYKQYPCPENIFVNVKLLLQALKFCKYLIRNEKSEHNMNDLVRDEF